MIKTNELRVGNFVLYLDELYKVQGVVTSIKNNGELYKRIQFTTIDNKLGNSKTENWLQPIPLTTETISNCTSLKLVHSSEWWDCYQSENGWYLSYAKHTEPSAGVEVGKFYHGEGFYPVECVHDLQNLYFYTSFKKELEFIW